MPTKKKPAWARHKKPASSPELTYPEGHEVMGANTIKITITGNDIWARQTGPDSVEVSDVPGRSVVDAADLARILTWFRGDPRTVPYAEMDATLERFTAAIDAARSRRGMANQIFTLWCDEIYLGPFSSPRFAMKAAYESLHQDIFPETRGIKRSDLATLTRAFNRFDWPAVQKIAEAVVGWRYQIKLETLDVDIEPIEVERLNDSGFWVADNKVEKLIAHIDAAGGGR